MIETRPLKNVAIFFLTRSKNKKHNRIVVLANIKSNSIETLLSHALIDVCISYEDFKRTVNKKGKYEQMKESIRNIKKK